MLNASMMTMSAKMRVYIFHSRPFRASIMSPFFCSHKLFSDVTLEDIRLCFDPLRYLTDGESDSDTWLTLTISMESDPSKSSYLDLLYGVRPFGVILSLGDLLDFRFFRFFYWPNSTLGSRTRIHSYLCCTLWAWVCPWSGTRR